MISFPVPSASQHRGRRSALGFTLIEMLTVVALLIIVLGLMVSLATDVRQQSSERLTKDLLRKLDVLMGQYLDRHKKLPQVSPFIETAAGAPEAKDKPAGGGAAGVGAAIPVRGEDELPDEATLLASAESNNRDFVQLLKSDASGPQPELFGTAGGTTYDEVTLRDAWGTPIVFMPAQHPAIGMALGNKPFFFSAGPDRKFRTLEDNLYSYEQSAAAARDGERPRD